MSSKTPELKVGSKAPDFTLPLASNGNAGTLTLSEKSGVPVVLFFYPKDDTPGCTTETLDFTARLDEFRRLGVDVIGMSPDPVKKHLKFQEKHGLTVPLVADEEHTALAAYGVWQEKSMYGKIYMGVERSTFLIGRDGKILKIWRKVKVKGHVDEVLQAVSELDL